MYNQPYLKRRTQKYGRRSRNRRSNRSRKLMRGGAGDDIVPTFSSNMAAAKNVAMAAATNVIADGIYSVANKLGIDPKKPAEQTIHEVGNSMQKLVAVLKSPEGEQLKQNASEVLLEGVEVAEPSINKMKEIAKEAIVDLTKTGTSAGVAALNELPPVFLVNEASKLGTAAVQAGKAVADLTTTGATAYKDMEPQINKGSSIIGQLYSMVNNGASDLIHTANNAVTNMGENLEEKQEELHTQEEDLLRGGGRTSHNILKNYSKQAKMIGGRIQKSQLDFFTGHTKSSKIIQSHRRKQTKRNKSR
jgi:hypothetical protein